MYTLFLVCALVGGTLLLLQLALALIGVGADNLDLVHDVPDDLPGDLPYDLSHDLPADLPVDLPVDLVGDLPGDLMPDSSALLHSGHAHGSTWLFGVISFRTVVAAVTFFGLAGLTALSAEVSGPLTLLIAVAAGAAAMYGVHYLMRKLYRLGHDGTARIERTVGECGTVYIPIPPNHQGLGKVQIRAQGRIMEYAARTLAPERLPTGTTVAVTQVLDATTVEVAPIDEPTTRNQE